VANAVGEANVPQSVLMFAPMTTARLALLVVAALAFAMPLFAQPKLQVAKAHDWGRVIPKANVGEQPKVTAEVPFENVGTEPLIMTEVRPSCGCTSAPLDKDTLAPGATTVLRVSLNLPQQNGPIEKWITIRTNEPDNYNVHLLALRADIQRPIQLSQAYFAFNSVVLGKETEAAVTLTTILDATVAVDLVESTPGLSFDIPFPIVLEPNGNTTIRAKYTPIATGPFSVEVVLATSIEGFERITISGFGTVDAPATPAKK
jgi:hypothetical protein